MKNKKIMVTAFEPFGNDNYNPTMVLLEALTGVVIKVLLPVSYKRAAEKLKSAISENRPDAVICTGLAGGRSEICIERVALNIKDAGIPDNDGEKAHGEAVITDAENALFTSLPIYEYADALRKEGFPCRVSYNAGTYVCNSTYFCLMETETPGIFVHIPYDESFGKTPFLKLEESIKAITRLIELTEKYL